LFEQYPFNVTTLDKQFWFEIRNNSVEPETPDGFFVVFFPHNLNHNSAIAKRNFVGKFRNFLYTYKIPYVRLSQPNYDRCVLYTTCNKTLINDIETNLKKEFSIRIAGHCRNANRTGL